MKHTIKRMSSLLLATAFTFSLLTMSVGAVGEEPLVLPAEELVEIAPALPTELPVEEPAPEELQDETIPQEEAVAIVSGAFLAGIRYGSVGQAIAAANGADAVITVQGSVRWDDRTQPNEPSDYWADGQKVTVRGGETAVLLFQSTAGVNNENPPAQRNYTLHMNGPLTIDDITIHNADARTAYFLACGYPFTMGHGVSEVDGSNWLNVYGGADGASVDSTELNLLGGNYTRVFGGGRNGGGVTGDTSVTVGSSAYVAMVYGSGFKTNVGGNASITVDGEVTNVFGAYRATVAGDVTMSLGGNVHWVAGGYLSTVDGDVTMDVPVGGEVENLGGGINNTRSYLIQDSDSWGGEQDDEAVSADHETMSAQNTFITVAGFASSVAGGGNGGDVRGNTNVTISGTANHVQGGGFVDGNVMGDTNVTISGTVDAEQISEINLGGAVYGAGFMSYVAGNTNVTLTETGSAYTVLGGGDNGYVKGASYVTVDGTVKQHELLKSPISKRDFQRLFDREIRYSGSVYGGSYISSMGYQEGSVLGGTNVTIGTTAKIDRSVYGGSLYGNSGSTQVTINGGTIGGMVYGGGWLPDADGVGVLGLVDGNTSVILTGDVSVPAVYGGGDAGNVTGTTSVELRDNSRANVVYAASSNQTSLKLTDLPFAPVLTTVGSSSVTLKDSASADVIYGYELLADKSNVTGASTVTFDGNTGAAKQIINASAVAVTNAATVTMDNEGKDNEQLVNVADLSISGGSKLTLPASAHILGNYTGDTAENKGKLVLTAGKGLTADGTVTGQTDISIVDTASVKPAEAQVYIVSGAGSTTETGGFTWTDRRTGLTMEWKGNENQTSQWWLVKADDSIPPVNPPDVTTYKITVKYVNLAGEELAGEYTTRKNAGTRYDVTDQAAKAIAGYTVDRVEGTTQGTLRGNVTITVYYKVVTGPDQPDTEIPEEVPPLAPQPDTDIPEDGTPLDPQPEVTPEVPGTEDDIIIIDPDVPKGNLPQTGTGRRAGHSAVLGGAALTLSAMAAGVALTLVKKKEY